jgi:BASS family bile acid:Na+ symporter
MSDFMQFLEGTFPPLILVFTLANLGAMGLQVKIPGVIAQLKNKKTLALIVVWGWVLRPAVVYLIAWVLPMSSHYVIALLLLSLAPCAPFIPVMVGKARGDVNFAAALIPIVAFATVVFMAVIGPLLIKGLTISTWDLAKPLLIFVLAPLALGTAFRRYAETVATKILPAVMVIAKITTLLVGVNGAVIYARAMLATVGSFGFLSMTIFMVVMGLITYRFGFGLRQDQRSVMSLGMLTSNVSVVMIVAIAIPDADPALLTYIIMYTIASIPFAAIAARIFGKQAGKTVAGDTI